MKKFRIFDKNDCVVIETKATSREKAIEKYIKEFIPVLLEGREFLGMGYSEYVKNIKVM